MGRSLLAMHNIHVTGKWWKGKASTTLKIQAPAWVIKRLEVFIVIQADGYSPAKLGRGCWNRPGCG
jgi:hypothetical protein